MMTSREYVDIAIKNKFITVIASQKALLLLLVFRLYIEESNMDVAITACQGLILAFDDGNDHLEFEIFGDGRVEVFFLKRKTNETSSDMLNDNLALSDRMIERLKTFQKKD